MLKLKNINVTLGGPAQLARQVLNNLSLNVCPGEFVVIIGGNGAGKSTLFNVISGFLKPDSGQVLIDGSCVTDIPVTARSGLVAKVMQDPKVGTMENMTIFENMAFALKRGQRRRITPFFSCSNRKFFQKKLQSLNMGLENMMDELVCNLSGGQRQALSLIMSVVADAKILLLDEITAALDPSSSNAIMQLTAELIKAEKRTCVMITHDMNQAIKYGDRLLLLKNGSFSVEYDAYTKSTLTPSNLVSRF